MKSSFVCPELCNPLVSLILLVCLKVMNLSPHIGYGSVWVKVIYCTLLLNNALYPEIHIIKAESDKSSKKLHKRTHR